MGNDGGGSVAKSMRGYLALALVPRAQALGPVGVLSGVLVGVALANPLASLGPPPPR